MVFLIGSMTSVMFLFPTLRSKAAQVPRATSVPSMLIGGAYSMTFFTLGMTFSAMGSFAACTMWSLIAAFRSPDDSSLLDSVPSDNRPVKFLTTQYQRIAGNRSTPDHSTESGAAEEPFEQSSENDARTEQGGLENEFDVAANSD